MRKSLFVFAALASACAPQEPAETPLAPPPPAAAPIAAAPDPEPPAPPPELTTEEAVKMYQDCWAAFNAKDFAKFAPCYADDSVSEEIDQGVPAVSGKDIIEKKLKPLVAAFPDLVGEPQLILARDNTVVGIFRIQGTHQGGLPMPDGRTLPATQKRVSYLMGHQVDFSEGKAKREHVYYDARTLLGQLGLVPGPMRKPKEQAAGAKEQGTAPRPVVVASASEGETKNLEVFRRYVEAVNSHDAKKTEPFLADDVVFSDLAAPADLVGKKELQRGLTEMWKSMSDLRIEPKNAWAAGDYVVATSTLSGTNDGPMPSMKLKKTGKKVSLNALEIALLKEGKIKRHWVFSNGMAFAAQLGLIPDPKAAPAPAAASPKAKDQPAAKRVSSNAPAKSEAPKP